jgi:hypothetical protein
MHLRWFESVDGSGKGGLFDEVRKCGEIFAYAHWSYFSKEIQKKIDIP